MKSMTPGNFIVSTGSHNSTFETPLAASLSCILIAAACSPARPPPSILVSRPISPTERSMPTVSDGLLPDLEGEEPGLADDRKRTGQFHAEADLDRFLRPRSRRSAQQHCRRDTGVERMSGVRHFRPPLRLSAVHRLLC